ncbi:hypothetical protein NMW25_24080, partial [Escherichia coli]|nr:hypothetical protein [Escherichia coli]
LTFQNHTNRPLTDFGGKTSIFSHPVYLFLREFSLQDFRGGSHAVFNYLCRVANERIFYARGNNRNIDENILRQIKKIVPHPDTALHAYCSGQSKNVIRHGV